MPYKNYNKRMSEYMLRRYHQRRAEAIESLGGECAVCKTKEDLEIDHIEPEDKDFTISKMWSISKAKFLKELSKCQVLCKKHHLEKSLGEGSLHKSPVIKPRMVHGSIWTFKKHKCRCPKCVSAYKKIHPNSKIRAEVSGA